MDVDRHNFKKVFDLIAQEQLVERSECVSVDLEFTGLRFDNNEKERNEDYLFERYDKVMVGRLQMRNVVRKYSIIQVGFSFFVRNADVVNAYPFNFYVYPRAYRNTNPQVCMQSSTIEFNSKNGMDWNRWIRDGITYVPLDKVAEALAQPQKQSTFEQLEGKLNEEQSAEMLLARRKLEKFVQDTTKQEDELEVTSTFVRLVMERLLEKEFPGIYLEPFNCDSPLKEKLLLSIRKVNTKDREQIRKEINLSIIGFTALFDKIWKRPNLRVVGHNSFFDLLYLMNSFVAELPISYIKFKQQASTGFPDYYDTKFLSSRKEFNGMFEGGTSLEQLQRVILSEKFQSTGKIVDIKLAEKFEDYDWRSPSNKARLHQAGYDSYLTGWVYYQLASRLQNISKYGSRLPVMRSIWDLNLKVTSDDFNEEGLVMVILINKPKEFCANLFEFKRKKTYQTIELLNGIFGKGRYGKEDVKIREYRVDFIFVVLQNVLKRRQFVQDLFQLREKGLADLRTMGTFVRERLEQIDPSKK